MYCKKCGRKIMDGAKFCGNCGTPVTERTERAEIPIRPEPPRKPEPEEKVSKKPRRKWLKGIAAVLVAVVLIGAVGVSLLSRSDDYSSDDLTVSSNTSDNISVTENVDKDSSSYDGADSLMATDEIHIVTDEETGIEYVDNIVLAFIQNSLTDAEKESIAALVDGEIVGHLSGALNMLQIQVEVSTMDELEAMADTLETSELVDSAAFNPLLEVVEIAADSSSTSDDSWWRNIINIDEAWDEFGEYFEDEEIHVGVIDCNIDLSDPDLNGRFQSIIEFTTNKGTSHGTTVSRLLAGNNGVIDSDIAKGYFASWADHEENNTMSADVLEEYALLCAAINAEVNAGCKVINNSYGATVYYDEETYANDASMTSKYSSYETYLYDFNIACELSMDLMTELSCELIENNDDILFVVGAGNGIGNYAITGCSATLSGNWAAITDSAIVEGICSEHNLTYQDLKDHIIIVTANDSNYDYTGFSYGDTVDISAPQSATSFATPLVSGTAALVWAAEPSLTAAQVKEILVTAYQHLATSGDYSGTVPVLNTYMAVQKALYASYVGTVLSADNTPAEGIYVYAKDADGNVLSDDVTDSNGEYVLYCNRLEIDHVSVYQNDEEAVTIDVPEEYQVYDYYAALYDEETGYAPHDVGATTLEELMPWKEIYAEYMQNIMDDDGTRGRPYALVYVDEDEMPELYVGGLSAAEGDRICTIDSSGAVVECWLNRTGGAAYIEKSGMFYNYNGNNGVLTLDFYSLADGVFTKSDLSAESVITYDEASDDFVTTYKWEGKSVSEEVFYANWNSVMARDRATSFYAVSVSESELLDLLAGNDDIGGADLTAYTSVVQQYENTYGTIGYNIYYQNQETRTGEACMLTGLCLVQPIDFDGDSVYELLIGYGETVDASTGQTEVCGDVWGLDGDTPVLLYSGASFPGESYYNAIAYKSEGGVCYLYDGYSENRFAHVDIYGLEDGSFTKVYALEADFSSDSPHYTLNGTAISMTEYAGYVSDGLIEFYAQVSSLEDIETCRVNLEEIYDEMDLQ